jgi:hypothetical protein
MQIVTLEPLLTGLQSVNHKPGDLGHPKKKWPSVCHV